MPPVTPPITPAPDPLERETIRRVAWRLMPLLMLGYFCAYLDRVNVGYAGLQMNTALGFSSSVFGFGSGIFFFGYFLFELPSMRSGIRRQATRRMVSRSRASGAGAVGGVAGGMSSSHVPGLIQGSPRRLAGSRGA